MYSKAKAWHDHGHENNPKLPRWEDSRKSSGFNFRMNEIQAAIGMEQLKKLNKLINFQNKKKSKLENIVKKFNFKARTKYKNCIETSDSFIFFTRTSKEAIKLKAHLENHQISTKILPEAIKWHFAGEFSHIKEIKKIKYIKSILKNSKHNLSKAISLPIMVKDKNIENKLYNALKVFI